MKRATIVIMVILMVGLIQGCGASLLSKIPDRSFGSITYNRNILGSIGHIEAKNGHLSNGILEIEMVNVKEVLPWGQVEFTITDLKKEVDDNEL